MQATAGVVAALAQHDEHLATEQILMSGQLGQKAGVAARRGLERGVRQFRGGTKEPVDDGDEIGGLSPDQDLNGLSERVEKARESRDQRFLLGEGAEGEGHRSGPTHERMAVRPEIDAPVGLDAHQRESQWRR